MYPFLSAQSSMFVSNIGTGAFESPFGNCQTYSLSYAANIFSLSKENCLEYLKDIQNKVLRSQLMIDIINSKELTKNVEEIFENSIIFKQEYINKTGTNMIIYLLDTYPIKQ